MKKQEKMSAEELLDLMELKPLIDWETYQNLIADYPHLEEDLLVMTQHPKK